MAATNSFKLADNKVVCVDAELADLIPGFLKNRRRDVKSLLEALNTGDYQTIQTVAHQLKGVGGGYGFDVITTIGGAIEQAAQQEIVVEIRKRIRELAAYLAQVKVRVA